MYADLEPQSQTLSFGRKIRLINWGLVLLVTLITGIGIGLLYSAAGGKWDPWAMRQLVRSIPGFVIMLAIAVVDIRVWLRRSAWAPSVGSTLAFSCSSRRN